MDFAGPDSGVVGCFAPAGGAEGRRLLAAFSESAEPHHYSDGVLAVAWAGSNGESSNGEVVAVDGDLDAVRAVRRAPAPYAPGDEIWLERPFAGVDWNAARATGALVCDPSGARQLYLLGQGGRLLFATSLGLLLRAADRRPAVDETALAEWLAVRHLGIGRSLYERVAVLPSARRIRLLPTGWSVERYWRPRPRPDVRDGPDDAATALREAILGTIRRLTATAEKPAVLLSGGLDSGSVVASAAEVARVGGQPSPGSFSGVFSGYPDLDESPYIDAVSEQSGVESRKITLAAGGLPDAGAAFRRLNAVPTGFPGGLMFRPVSSAASGAGVDVLLDGEGGDELFGCEPLLAVDRLVAGRPLAAWQAVRELPGMGDRLRARAVKIAVRSWLLPHLIPAPLMAARRGTPEDRPSWLRVPLPSSPPGERWPRHRPLWRSRMEWQLTTYRDAIGAHQHLRGLERLGRVPMLHPFYSASLTEVVLALPPERAFDRHDDRALLRDAMQGLLAESVRRRPDKTYFNAPVLDALFEVDRESLEARFAGRMKLEPLVDADELRRTFRAGPHSHPRSPFRWAMEVWRAYAAEDWLASLA